MIINKLIGLVFLFTLLITSCALKAQERFDSGPYKGFLKEQPELNTIEIPKPFTVARVTGSIVYLGNEKIPGAVFEIRDSSGHVLSATTDERGLFALPDVPPGTYVFKATKNRFHSVVGKIVVSHRYSKKNAIHISLQLGT